MTTTDPTSQPNMPPMPQWLIDAADAAATTPTSRGIAIGFAAAGWVAGWQAATEAQQAKPDLPASAAGSEDQE